MELASGALFRDANIKGYWRLESDGADSSGNGKTLSAVGSPTYVPGQYGNAVRLPTITDNLTRADAFGVEGGACSIVAWIKQETEIASSSVNFIQHNSATINNGNSISYEYNAGTRRLYFRRSKWNVAHEGPYYNVALGTGWNHIVYTYDGTNVRGYLNGVLVAGPTAASGNGSGAPTAALTLVPNPSGACRFDDVAIFNRALSLAEVESLYRGNPNFFQMF